MRQNHGDLYPPSRGLGWIPGVASQLRGRYRRALNRVVDSREGVNPVLLTNRRSTLPSCATERIWSPLAQDVMFY